MKQNLKEIYDDIFAASQGKKKNNFQKYFPYRDEVDYKKKITMLLDEYYTTNESYDFDPKVYVASLIDVVKKYKHNKDALISVYRDFNNFLEKEYALNIEIKYPPIPVYNTFERLMFIAKYLQDDKHRIADLTNILWQSQRTIDGDILKLQGNDRDSLEICGQKFTIPETDRSMGHLYFESTAHPFFLACNLTQVIATLEGLKEMCERPGFEGYAMPLARNIWRQLSEYGKDRVSYVMNSLLCQDTSWYDSLDEEEEDAYRTERECCSNRDGILMYCLKNGDDRLCHIEYKGDNKSEFLTDVQVLQLNGEGWKVRIGGEERILEPDRILKSSFYKENMF